MTEAERKQVVSDHLAHTRSKRTRAGFVRSREVCQAGAKKRWENWRAKRATGSSVA